MATTRRNAMLIDDMRQLIDARRIINRLQDHIANKVKMRESQVRAANILLRKVIPDLSNVELQAGSGGPILIVTGIMRPEPAMIEAQPSSIVIDEAKPLPESIKSDQPVVCVPSGEAKQDTQD